MIRYTLKQRVLYKGQETQVAGTDPDGWVLILVKNYMKHTDGRPLHSEPIVAPNSSDTAVVDLDCLGQDGYWLTPGNVGKYLEPFSEKPKGPDGCFCIRCNQFCGMSENNLCSTEALSVLDPNSKIPNEWKKAFACRSCRTTVGWWLEAQGWTLCLGNG